MSNQEKTLKRQIGFFSATMILVGTVIGSGIFMTPGKVAAAAGSSGPNLLAWVIAGFAATMFALVYAELAPMLPKAGGAYVFIREAFGDMASFLYGWAMIFGSLMPVIALLAVAFITYLKFFFPGINLVTGRVISSLIVAVLAYINVIGVKQGTKVQNIFTIGKLTALGLVIVGGLFSMKGANFQPFVGEAGWGSTFNAAVPAVLAFGGYYVLSYMSEEVENPKKNLGRAVIFGMAIVIVVNVLINVVSIGNVPFDQLAESEKPVADVAMAIFGPVGASIVSLGALVSIFGSLNSSVMGLPRLSFAMSREKLLFNFFSKLHPKYGTPYISTIIFAVAAIFFIWTGTFMSLLLMGIFVSRSLECVVAISLIVLRYKKPELERPIKMWGYPVTTLLAVLITGYLVTLVDPNFIKQGAFLALSSIPAYLVFKYLVPRFGKKPVENK
ncbi:MAG TPA: amino acid permease [Anaerolineae bacterium]|nr:amino acid permease [Anaerolineae bacterium]